MKLVRRSSNHATFLNLEHFLKQHTCPLMEMKTLHIPPYRTAQGLTLPNTVYVCMTPDKHMLMLSRGMMLLKRNTFFGRYDNHLGIRTFVTRCFILPPTVTGNSLLICQENRPLGIKHRN